MQSVAQLNPQDLVFISVVGVNGSSRKTKAVSQFFNGIGSPVGQDGTPVSNVPAMALSGRNRSKENRKS